MLISAKPNGQHEVMENFLQYVTPVSAGGGSEWCPLIAIAHCPIT